MVYVEECQEQSIVETKSSETLSVGMVLCIFQVQSDILYHNHVTILPSVKKLLYVKYVLSGWPKRRELQQSTGEFTRL